MTDEVLRDPLVKRVLRGGWSAALAGHALLSWPTSGGVGIRVFYGGARPGDVGGPLVKVKRLRATFPESWWRYSVVYTLSNTPYLPDVALALLKFRGMPIVHNQNGVFYPAWFKGDWRARNARMARTFHQADHVFFQSRFCQRSAEKFLGARSGTSEVLYNAVDTGVFRPAVSGRDEHRQRFRFLITGKISSNHSYRVESTIRGLAEARREGLDCVLEVAGWLGDDTLDKAKDLCLELNVSDAVTFSGPYSQAQAPTIYQRADAYVMTNHHDACPNTVLEALACGLPVLYADSGGVGELVGPSGVAIPSEENWDQVIVCSPRAVGDGMAEIAVRAADLSAVARKRAVERFDISHWMKRHEEVFNRLTGERS